MEHSHTLTKDQSDGLIRILKTRFETNRNRHPNLKWTAIEERLRKQPHKLWSLNEMERTGGEPDVMERNDLADKIVFYDFSEESPKGRRSLCYDREALESRKNHPPKASAVDMAHQMGIELLTEDDYHRLQKFGPFDLKTSSWLKTPSDIRKVDGSIFGDYRFGRVFIYHNGAQSYYAGRGFRGLLKI